MYSRAPRGSVTQVRVKRNRSQSSLNACWCTPRRLGAVHRKKAGIRKLSAELSVDSCREFTLRLRVSCCVLRSGGFLDEAKKFGGNNLGIGSEE